MKPHINLAYVIQRSSNLRQIVQNHSRQGQHPSAHLEPSSTRKGLITTFIMNSASSNSSGASTPTRPTHAPSISISKPTSSSAARRNALREFYKLSHSKPETIAEGSPSGSNGDGEELQDADDDFVTSPSGQDVNGLDRYLATAAVAGNNGPDGPASVADSYITSLVEKNDLRGLLKQENLLVNEIRTLDSEGKALVYNNYSKLTAASAILASLQTEVDEKLAADKIKDLETSLKIVASAAATKTYG